jgi:hypothetical protein
MWSWKKAAKRETQLQSENGPGLRLQITITSTTVLTETKEETVLDENCELILAPQSSERRWPGHRRIFDFDKARDFLVDKNTSEYTDDSLFATAHFRHAEFQNRQYIRGVLKAGGVDDPSYSPCMISHQFSLSSAEPKADAIKWKRGGCEATTLGQRLFLRSEGHTTVSKANAARFARFLRYQVAGHPLILDRIVQDCIVPNQVEFWMQDTGTTTHQVICVNECAEEENLSYTLDGLTEVPGDDAVAYELPPVDAEVQQLLTDGKELDALLVVLSYSLSGGEIDTKLRALMDEAIANSAHAAEFQTLLANSPSNDEEAQQYLDSMEKFTNLATRNRSLFGVFAAPIHAVKGDIETAIALYKSAIDASPFLAGAHKDLGDILISNYLVTEGYRH